MTSPDIGPVSGPAPVPPKPPFRWVRLVLFVSLALNLGVLGMVGGALLGRAGHERAEFAVRDIGFGVFTEALEEEDRQALRRAYGQARPNIRADRRAMRNDFQTLLAALRADPFDAEGLRAVLQGAADRIAQRQALGQTVLMGRVEGMTPTARAALANRLEQSLKRRPRRDQTPQDDG